MALINTPKTSTFDDWRINTNTTASQLGDNATLVANTTLSSTNAVDAILEVLAKEQLEVGDVSTLTTTATNLSAAVVELDADVGNKSTLTTAYKTNVVGAINELDADVGAPASLTTTAKTNLVAAVNELDAEHGVLSSLTTTEQGTLVGAVNEIVSRESSRYSNTLKLDLSDATVGGANTSTQAILSNVSTATGKTLTVNGTLDVSNGSLIVGGAGGTLNIQTTYLVLGDANATVASSGGVVVSRGKDSGTAREDVRVYWDESSKKWSLKKFADDGTTVVTPFILDSYNIKDFVTGNTENGIAVTYNESTNKLNFDVADFTITLTGDVTGTGTVTNLGNVSFAATIQPNSVALGTDTTGAYVASVTLATTTPGISLTQSSAGNESNAITALSVDSTVIRNFGAQTVAGVKTLSDKPIFSTGFTSSAASSVAGTLTVSTGGVAVTGDSTFANNVTITGNLTVDGTTTTFNSTTLTVDDKNIELGSVASPTNATANGGGITLKGATDKTITWDSTNSNWTSSEHWNLNSTSQVFKIGNVEVLSRGAPNKLFQTPVVSYVPTQQYGSFDRTGTAVTVTTASAHGLSTGNQIDILGDSLLFYGLGFTITVTSSTVFTYTDSTSGNASDSSVKFARNTANSAVVLRDQDGSLVANYFSGGEVRDAQWRGKVITTTFGGTGLNSYSTGDIIYASSANTLAKLAKGTDGQVLKLSGGVPTWGTDNNTDTNTTYSQSAVTTTGGAFLRLTAGGSGSGNDDTKLASGTGVNVAYTDASTITFSVVTEDIQDIVGAMVTAPNPEDGIAVTYDDTNGKLTFNVNDAVISLTGAVTGSGTMTNLGDVSISTSINTTSTDFQDAVKALMPKIYDVSGTQVFP